MSRIGSCFVVCLVLTSAVFRLAAVGRRPFRAFTRERSRTPRASRRRKPASSPGARRPIRCSSVGSRSARARWPRWNSTARRMAKRSRFLRQGRRRGVGRVAYADGAIKGTCGNGCSFEMKRVKRKSPALGEKPPEGPSCFSDGKGFDELTKRKNKDGTEQPWKARRGRRMRSPRAG